MVGVDRPPGGGCAARHFPLRFGAIRAMNRLVWTTTRYEIIGEGQHRVLAQGWWADVEYRWDRAADDWRVMILDTNAYGRISLFDMALAANDGIGGGEVPREKLVWAETGGRLLNGPPNGRGTTGAWTRMTDRGNEFPFRSR